MNLYYLAFYSGCSAARLARFVRDEEVGSSNLLTPTNKIHSIYNSKSLKFKIYVGQTINLERRFLEYNSEVR